MKPHGSAATQAEPDLEAHGLVGLLLVLALTTRVSHSVEWH
jgi:hypothetical protein